MAPDDVPLKRASRTGTTDRAPPRAKMPQPRGPRPSTPYRKDKGKKALSAAKKLGVQDMPSELQCHILSYLIPDLNITLRTEEEGVDFLTRGTVMCVNNRGEWSTFLRLLRVSKSLHLQAFAAFEHGARCKRIKIVMDMHEACLTSRKVTPLLHPKPLEDGISVSQASTKWLDYYHSFEIISMHRLVAIDAPAFLALPGPAIPQNYSYKVLTTTIDKIGVSPKPIHVNSNWTSVSQPPSSYAVGMVLAEGFDEIACRLREHFKDGRHKHTSFTKRMLRYATYAVFDSTGHPFVAAVTASRFDEAFAVRNKEWAEQREREEWSARLGWRGQVADRKGGGGTVLSEPSL